MERVRLVLCDMDGTLIPHGNETVSEMAIAAAHRLMEAGVRFGASSGRDLADLRRIFRGDGRCLQTAVASNGCSVRLDGVTLVERPLDREDLETALDLVRREPDAFLCVGFAGERIALGAPYDEVRAHYRDWPSFDMVVQDALPEGPVLKANVCLPRSERSIEELDRNQALVRRLQEACPHIDFCLLGGHVADMMPTGVTKATGLTDILTATGIACDEVLVFGDSENDEAIMRAVPHAVAVADATPAIRSLARHHVGPCADDAVAHCLEELADSLDQGRLPSWLDG